MDASDARARLLAWLGPSPPMAIDSCVLSARGTHWFLTANTEQYLRTRDVSYALVGVGVYLIDRSTGEIEAFGTHVDPEELLTDRHHAVLDAGTHWIVRPQASLAATVRLRQWLECPPGRARDLMRLAAWFTGARREAHDAAQVLQGLGITVEVVQVDDPAGALPLWRCFYSTEGLRQALAGSGGAALDR